MLVNSNQMLRDAKLKKQAVFQFNINNLEWTKWILEECNKQHIPVILGASEGAISYMGGYDVVVSLVKSLIKDLNILVDVCLHLDHAKTVESCKKAIDSGFTSVMIDLSKMSFEDNIKGTSEVVSYAKDKNVSVESELGSMGNITDKQLSLGSKTNVSDCIRFVKETGINSLAASVGTVHGLYTGNLDIDYELINQIAKAIEIPLVLHGGSGLSNEILKKCVKNGITKININSDLQNVWSIGVRNYLNENKEAIDPRKIISGGYPLFCQEIEHKININK